ncbi:hypothetical protein N9773_00125 [Flavobacteriaceae bacterium]|nr:hypothetical protein [Flavobacteriaceae bacterium]
MKALKLVFSLLTLTAILFSCSPQDDLQEDNPNAIENPQATGDDTTTVDNGSKPF